MNVQSIDPTVSALNQAKAAANAPSAQTPASREPAVQARAVHHERPATPPRAQMTTPATTVTITSVPASVKPEDRTMYLQMLKAFGGNVSAALAALAAKEKAEGEG